MHVAAQLGDKLNMTDACTSLRLMHCVSLYPQTTVSLQTNPVLI